MNLLGVEKIVFGVENLDLAKRFWRDFGLEEAESSPEHGLYRCATRAAVEVRKLDDPSLPAPVTGGSTARETVWAAADQATVDALAAELSQDREVTQDADGTIHALDPEGNGIGFTATKRVAVSPPDTLYNGPGHEERFDRPAKFYESATPQHLAHVVFQIDDLEGTPAFYRERLGFKLTDAYAGRGEFLRCGNAVDHHNLFLFHVPGVKGFHHICFEVHDFHEVFGGGLHMRESGWNTHLGPGRHNVTSAYFWYFKAPSGGAAELGYDTDRVTDAWTPRVIEPTPGAFAEWALDEGMDRYAGLQRAVETG